MTLLEVLRPFLHPVQKKFKNPFTPALKPIPLEKIFQALGQRPLFKGGTFQCSPITQQTTPPPLLYWSLATECGPIWCGFEREMLGAVAAQMTQPATPLPEEALLFFGTTLLQEALHTLCDTPLLAHCPTEGQWEQQAPPSSDTLYATRVTWSHTYPLTLTCCFDAAFAKEYEKRYLARTAPAIDPILAQKCCLDVDLVVGEVTLSPEILKTIQIGDWIPLTWSAHASTVRGQYRTQPLFEAQRDEEKATLTSITKTMEKLASYIPNEAHDE